jgi:uncharacterized protein involved in outer membrane biogenesis
VKEDAMAFRKKLFVIAVVAMFVLVAALAIVWTNLDWIVKNAIEKYGSQAIGTSVRVRGVSLHPASGKGSISGLTVENPKGFSAPHIISLGGISVHLSPRTITANPVVIDDIRIASPLIVYEMNDNRVSNVDMLKKNLESGTPAKSEPAPRKTPKEAEKRLRIKRLVIENAKADVRVASLGKPRTVALSRIEMTDLGGKNGAPPEDIAKEIAAAILSRVTREVGKEGAEKLLEKGLERMLKRKQTR